MAVKLIIDSAADILPETCRELGITHLPLKVVFPEGEYADAVDLTHHAFYEKLVESDALPTTCQVSPADFSDAIERQLGPEDSIIIITMSGKLSGTCQSAMIAAADYPDRVFVVDSESVSLGERILIQEALALIREGKSASEIAQILHREKKSIRLMALLDTLEYLKKGGRISSATALAGTLLSIKPVIAVEEGAVVMAGKARGSRQGNNLLRELVQKCGGINFDKPFCLAYSGLSDALLQKYIADSADLWEGNVTKLPIATVGCAIGTHVGPGAIAVAFFEK